MGPLGSKHAEHEGQSDAISDRTKKSFLSRLRRSLFQGKRRSRKNHKKYSPLRMQRDKNLRPSHLDHQKPNGELTISKKGRSKKQRKKWHKEKKTLIEKEQTEGKSRRAAKLMEQLMKTEFQNNLKNVELCKSRKAPSEFHSIIHSSATNKMPDRQVQKNRRSQKGTASVRSIRKTLRSWRPTSARSSMSPSSRESIKSTRQRIKALFSRPMQEASLQKFVERIKKRKELLEEKNFKQKVPETPIRSADEKFPSKRRVERYKSETKEENDKIIQSKDEEKSSEEATDEDLPMDSDILLEVQAGLRKLVKMPEIRIVMDPYAPLDYLKSRDKIFFTTEVVFSNTVRSMVNLNDEISNKELISMRNRKLSKILIEEPLEVTRYDEDNPLINKRVPIR